MKLYSILLVSVTFFHLNCGESMTKIAIIGGLLSDGDSGEFAHTDNVEIIDISGDNLKCLEIPNYNRPIYQLSATFMDDEILACGGQFNENYDVADCLKLGTILRQWQELDYMPYGPEHLMVILQLRKIWSKYKNP